MPVRLAACDPCRFSKLACDHARPVCQRCRKNGRSDTCTYRTKPFKKSRRKARLIEPREDSSAPTRPVRSTIKVSSNVHTYPNPGYLGSSSHVSIFDHLPSAEQTGNDDFSSNAACHRSEPNELSVDEVQVSEGATFIGQIQTSSNIAAYRELIGFWTAKGVNLALAGSFTEHCAAASVSVLTHGSEDSNASKISGKLFQDSCRSLAVDDTTTFDDFCANFCQPITRWETLGLFFTAVSRATIDVPRFESLYSTQQQRKLLQRLAMHYSDRCLDIAVSLDCLNDLLLMLQYENFILHSFVDGDQSYQSWRRLGDVISSLFALGYHDQTEDDIVTPEFLRDLRRAAFARTYSADKNISIFFGRPPRILRKYCRFQLPGAIAENIDGSDPFVSQQQFQWSLGTKFDYMADTWWAALCAILKEEALDLFREKDFLKRIEKGRALQGDAEKQWQALTPSLRLEGPLRSCDREPMERDFLVSAKLNHLHVLLLIRQALTRHIPNPDAELIHIAATMLSLTVEAIVLKEHLAWSGTSLVWRVAYYGLPAAGMVCLALLKQSFSFEDAQVKVPKVFQDLSVLIAEVETGALVAIDSPNYVLLAGATKTIKSILDQTIVGESFNPHRNQPAPDVSSQMLPADSEDNWVPWTNDNFWDFEVDFWSNLAEHPILLENDSQSVPQ